MSTTVTSSRRARSCLTCRKALDIRLRPFGAFPILLSVATVAVSTVGTLSADTPCGDKNVPSELCVTEARSEFGMVATGSPEATKTAVRILEMGGNAVDATVAAAFMLGVVESQSSGIGGVTNMVVHLANGRTTVILGTSSSPAKIDMKKFREFKKGDRTFGYETISVPTTLATLEYVRARYGTLELTTLLQPAIDTAEHGFLLSNMRIIGTRKYYDDIMNSSDYMRSLVLEDGRTIGKPGDRFILPDLANTYRRIATEGVRSFYFGAMAKEIEADMIRGGSFLRKSDLAKVSVREVRPLHTTYRDFDVYTCPPPGGGAGVITILNILENFASDFVAEDSAERHHVLLDTFRIAAADAEKVDVRLKNYRTGPLSKGHARNRSKLITPGTMVPRERFSASPDPECARSGENTTQISVADSLGNVVSLTQTLARSFGAKTATPGLGFPYNGLLAVFSADNRRCPNYLRPNMPIMTPMSPTIVLKDKEFVVALGSPGSNKIPSLVSEIISNMVDRKMGVRDAVTAPRVLWGGDPPEAAFIEVFGPNRKKHIGALEKMGFADITQLRYPPRGKTKMNYFGGVNAVAYDPERKIFTGVGDPRRFGSAKGPRVVAVRE